MIQNLTNMIAKRVLLLLSVCAFALTSCSSSKSFAQPSNGYEIKGKIKGAPDTVQLAFYWGDKSKILLHERVGLTNTKTGEFTFKGDTPLPQGIYIVVLPSKGYFEFVVNDDQHFSFSTDTLDFIKNMKVKDHEENEVFYNHLQRSTPIQKRIPVTKVEYDSIADSTSTEARKLRSELVKMSRDLNDIRTELKTTYKDYFITQVLTAMDEVEVPKMEDIEDPEVRKRARFVYYREHFMDNMDLSHPGMIRTPILKAKIEKYKTLHVEQADSLIKMVDELIEMTGENNFDMYKYLVNHFTKYSEKTKVMCMSKLKWHMYKRYYLDDPRTDWLDSAAIKKVQRYEYMMRYNHCGDIAQDLSMTDTNDVIHKISDIRNKYTVVVFWSATCGHCKKTMPKLSELYKRIKDEYDFEVYSVHIDREEKKWKEFIKKHNFEWLDVNDPKDTNKFRIRYNVYSTPTFYLLDENKKIIGKRFDVDLLEKILKDLEKEPTKDK